MGAFLELRHELTKWCGGLPHLANPNVANKVVELLCERIDKIEARLDENERRTENLEDEWHDLKNRP